ncbi:MAG: bifunctional precorrin-2 dehydrogenase/sirohydrochlorin ferrochelatase [Nitrospirae bacterium]|nr:bifunctional precorrin-2 dehydrogenase/sirohydrochlorin ferrochelatase [Nitrospirota bacterium]
MTYYPVFLDLRGKKCVIVGGGKVAERKATKLIEAGASLTVVSPELTPVLSAMKDAGDLVHVERQYTEGDLDGALIAIAATDDPKRNGEIAASFEGLINVVTSPSLCNFIVPSSINRGDLSIAVSTSGVSPALSRAIRLELETLYGEEFREYLEFLKGFRERVQSSPMDDAKREFLLREAGSAGAVVAIREGKAGSAISAMNELLRKML